MDFVAIANCSSNPCAGPNGMVTEQFSGDTVFYSEPTSPESTPPYAVTRRITGTYATLGIISAVIGLIILPEIFASAAIVLGAYLWRHEQGNRGIGIVILGIICMLVGLYLTAFFILGDLFLS